MKIELTERSVDIIGKSLDLALKEGRISQEEYEVVLRVINGGCFDAKEEEPLLTKKQYEVLWGVFSGNVKVPLPEMDSLEGLKPTGWYGVMTGGKVIPFKDPPKESDPKLNLTPDQMTDLYDDLVYAGLDSKVAASIVAEVARG